MNGMRKILSFLMTTVTIATLALSSGAAVAAKTYTLAMSPTTGTSPIATMTATLTNTGNSSFNSFTLQLPGGYTLTGTPTVSASKGTVSYNSSTRKVTVTNIGLPVGAGSGEVITVTMSNVATTTGSCGTGTPGSWVAAVYDGSSLNGASFSGNAASTSIAPLCYTVSGSTSAGGTVTCAPSPVSAGGSSACSVAINPGYTFTGFSANCGAPSTATSCTVSNVQATQTVTASFSQIPYAINGSTSAGGTVTCNPSSVTYGQSSTCSVAVNALYTFTGFSANCGAPTTATSCTVSNVQSSQTVTATFVSNVLAITSTAPTSAAVGTPFDVIIGSTPTGADVSFGTGCDASATKTTTATSTTFHITINTLPALPSTCTMTFTAPNYTQIQLANLQVYKGVLDCGDYDSSLGSSDLTLDPNLDKTFVVPNGSGWGLRRGPNKDGAACVRVNYTCDLDGATNIAACSYDKLSGQLATFKYVFVFAPRPADSTGPTTGWTGYRPQVSWGVANPDTTTANAFKLPDWVPLLACVDDMFPSLPTLPMVLLPYIPSVSPFTDAANTRAQYQPTVQALVCGAQLGWTSSGDIGTGAVKLQHWLKAVDEVDLKVVGP